MSWNNILLQKEDRVAIVTVNRPKVLNALNKDTLQELKDCFAQLKNDDGIRVVVITGAGEKAFVAGADIAYMAKMDALTSREWSQFAQEVMDFIAYFPKPVVAAVNGYALGGGNELAMACDIRIAADNAKFGQPEINLGVIPGFGGTQRLSALVGKGFAKKMIFSGDMINAEEAKAIGLVEEVVNKDELMEMVMNFAKKLAAKPLSSLILAKELINESDQLSFQAGRKMESECWGLCFATEDQKEGMDAFLNKRKASFK